MRAWLLVATLLGGCALMGRHGEAQVGGLKPNELQVMAEVIRFEGRFSALVADALDPLVGSEDPVLRQRALVRSVAYQSAAVSIAAGPNPAANLLDMATFVKLSAWVVRDYWTPRVLGPRGRALEDAFAMAQRDIDAIVGRYLTPVQARRLDAVIAAWRTEHPAEINVESVRLAAFTFLTQRRAERLASGSQGLAGNVSQGVQSVAIGVLLGERGVYLANRAPALFQLQARVLGSDLLSDVRANVERFASPHSLERHAGILQLIQEMHRTMAESARAAGAMREAVEAMKGLAESQDIRRLTDQVTALVGQANELARTARATTQNLGSTGAQAEAIGRRVEVATDRLMRKVFLLGCGMIGIAVVATLLGRLSYDAIRRRQGARRPPPGELRPVT